MNLQDLVASLPEARGARLAGNPTIQRITEDSRQVAPGDLFVARSGTRADGKAFVQAAIAAGAQAIVAAEAMTLPDSISFIQVPDAAVALAHLAHRFYGDPTRAMDLLGVTGTNGKTTIAYLVRAIFQAAAKRCGLIGTVEIDDGQKVFEAEMTTPGSLELARLFGAMRDHGLTEAVMETSSHALDQNRLAAMRFQVAMFTNLTGDHLDYHKTMEAYGDAKARLFTALEPAAVAVINQDDPWAARMVGSCRGRVVRYGLTPQSDWSAKIVSMQSAGMQLVVRKPVRLGAREFEELSLRSPLVGRHNVYNILCAAAAASALGISNEALVTGLSGSSGAPGRLEPVVPEGFARSDLPFQVLVDYAHTHDALENVLTALRPMTAGRLICLFGCGGDRDRTKRPKMAAVAELLADEVILTSDNPRTEEPGSILEMIQSGFTAAGRAKLHVQIDRRKAIEQAIGMAGRGDVVLLAGKGHEKYQILGQTKYPFDDVQEARQLMRKRL